MRDQYDDVYPVYPQCPPYSCSLLIGDLWEAIHYKDVTIANRLAGRILEITIEQDAWSAKPTLFLKLVLDDQRTANVWSWQEGKSVCIDGVYAGQAVAVMIDVPMMQLEIALDDRAIDCLKEYQRFTQIMQ